MLGHAMPPAAARRAQAGVTGASPSLAEERSAQHTQSGGVCVLWRGSLTRWLGVWSRFAVAGLPPHPWAATSHSRSRYSPAFPDPRLGRRQMAGHAVDMDESTRPGHRSAQSHDLRRRHPRCDGAQIAPFGHDSDCHADDRTAVQKWRLRARHAADRVISMFSQAGNAEDTEGDGR